MSHVTHPMFVDGGRESGVQDGKTSSAARTSVAAANPAARSVRYHWKFICLEHWAIFCKHPEEY